MNNLKQLINLERVTAISGDMNICLDKHPNCLLYTTLNDLGFQQLVNNPTHKAGGRIDHLYLRNPDSSLASFHLTPHVPSYRNHDALCLSMTPKVPYFIIIIRILICIFPGLLLKQRLLPQQKIVRDSSYISHISAYCEILDSNIVMAKLAECLSLDWICLHSSRF